MKRHFKLVAVVAAVLVTLSGFSPARSSGGSSSSGSSSSGSSGSKSSSWGSSGSKSSKGGGGCSSSSSRSHNRYGGGTSSNHHSSSDRDAGARGTVVKCAGAGEPAATVRVRNPGGYRSVEVEVDFLDEQGGFVDSGSTRVTVRRDGTKRVRVAMKQPKLVDEVEDCRVISVR